MLKIGILGCGAIGGFVARNLAKGRVKGAELAGVMDKEGEKAESLARECKAKAFADVETMATACDVVVEAASGQAVRDHAKAILEHARLVMMSSGALMDGKLMAVLRKTAEKHGTKLIIPSGALAGIDGLCAARGARKARLTTIKSPASLGITTKTKRIVFKGPASRAARIFPKNINIAASASLAVGMDIEVVIMADPKAKRNTHVLEVEGLFGKISVRAENEPLRDNPKSSELAAMACLAAIRRISEAVEIGN
ncbi:MAG: aspartate dehydrogenase [Candidatus Micrarchaeota archaeon]|nr:aspartate dehydrogenase [Candidatus Micrarchaeota archaeon]